MVKHLKLFRVQQVSETVVVCPQGQGSGFRYQDLHVEANAIRNHLLKTPKCNLIVDLGEMDYCGSEFIGSLVSMLRETRNRGGAALFCAANPHIHKVLENMSLFKLWPYFPNRDDALQAAAAKSAGPA
ncbi:MAG: STAS domain-containing protein [Planctomycetaceae bacterium]